MQRKFLLRDSRGDQDLGFVYACSGYLVENGKVLLVHHNGWNKWVPPGGHLEPGDSFARTAEREFEEETGLKVKAVSSQPNINPGDKMAVVEPVPFYIDVEFDFEPNPGIVQFYWVRRTEASKNKAHKAQSAELHGIDWFSVEQLKNLPTFEQVRKVAAYALKHHPDAL